MTQTLEQRKRDALEWLNEIDRLDHARINGNIGYECEVLYRNHGKTLRELCQPVGDDVEEAINRVYAFTKNPSMLTTTFMTDLQKICRAAQRAIRGEK